MSLAACTAVVKMTSQLYRYGKIAKLLACMGVKALALHFVNIYMGIKKLSDSTTNCPLPLKGKPQELPVSRCGVISI